MLTRTSDWAPLFWPAQVGARLSKGWSWIGLIPGNPPQVPWQPSVLLSQMWGHLSYLQGPTA